MHFVQKMHKNHIGKIMLHKPLNQDFLVSSIGTAHSKDL